MGMLFSFEFPTGASAWVIASTPALLADAGQPANATVLMRDRFKRESTGDGSGSNASSLDREIVETPAVTRGPVEPRVTLVGVRGELGANSVAPVSSLSTQCVGRELPTRFKTLSARRVIILLGAPTVSSPNGTGGKGSYGGPD